MRGHGVWRGIHAAGRTGDGSAPHPLTAGAPAPTLHPVASTVASRSPRVERRTRVRTGTRLVRMMR